MADICSLKVVYLSSRLPNFA